MKVSEITFPGVRVSLSDAALHLESEQPLALLSSAVTGAELETARHILCMYVDKDYRCDRPEDDLQALAHTLGIREPFVGLMTAARMAGARGAAARAGGLSVATLATVGLSNATAAGVSLPAGATANTINLIVLVDARLSRSAQVNAVITATEAKTLALVERNTRTRAGGYASGTSTDSVVIAASGRGATLRYAGTATTLGWLIGRTVRECMQAGG